jgi:hypothetical protein
VYGLRLKYHRLCNCFGHTRWSLSGADQVEDYFSLFGDSFNLDIR